MIIVIAFIGCAILAPLIAPHSPDAGSLASRLIPPVWEKGGSAEYLLGTDRLGRDVLSRLIYGARISMLVSVASILITGTLGSLVGIVAGYCGGWIDAALMRLADVSLSLPAVLIAILLASLYGPSFTNVIVVVIVALWPSYARMVRGETLSLRERDYVGLARVAGVPTLRLVARHLLPNLLPSLLVISTLQVGIVILLEASLSFLGAGIPSPTPSWGVMVSDGRSVIETAWWVSMVPGLVIALTVASLNLGGDWLRDRIDPSLRRI
jgi:peptide/nickel transport system permease protein